MMKGMAVLRRRQGSIKRAIDDGEGVFREAAQEWLDDDVLPRARELAPVATGALQSSIEGDVQPNQIHVRATADHARPVEEGTNKMPAQPFLNPAVQSTRRKLSQRVRDKFKRSAQQ